MNKIVLVIAVVALCGFAGCNSNRPAKSEVVENREAVESFAEGSAEGDTCFTVEEVIACAKDAETAE